MLEMMRRIRQPARSQQTGPPIPPRPDISGEARRISNNNGRLSNKTNKTLFLDSPKDLNFYHGKVETEKVEQILQPHLNTTGAYLLRDSNSDPDALTMSVVHTMTHIYHFKVIRRDGKYEVTKQLNFSRLQDAVNYFEIHDIPGSEVKHLRLTIPIEKKQLKVKEKSKSFEERSPVKRYHMQERRPSEPIRPTYTSRPPLPMPPTSPANNEQHIYTEAMNTRQDKINLIRQLCHEKDIQMQQIRQQCNCGLYLDESMLVHDWMMHRSIERGNDYGRIFFVNQKTDNMTWQLPDYVLRDLQRLHPSKYKRLLTLQGSIGI